LKLATFLKTLTKSFIKIVRNNHPIWKKHSFSFFNKKAERKHNFFLLGHFQWIFTQSIEIFEKKQRIVLDFDDQ